ncbi:hypothetical protein DFP73DRAFT_486996 [Morchella snyderi]|nr:hypothetical protein DFP73DRAFT_486996 [Morchella snyderi]
MFTPLPSIPETETETSPRFGIPSYLLQDIFTHLDLYDIISCQQVCRLWNDILQTRRSLRTKRFLAPTHLLPSLPAEKYTLHPVFGLIHFSRSLCVADTTLGRRGDGPAALLKDSPVCTQYATDPPTAWAAFEVLKFHPYCVVENVAGVTVWDVMVALTEYKTREAKISFGTFFGTSICSKRNYDRSRRMRHADFLGTESVFIDFSGRDERDPRVFIGTSFEARGGSKKGKLFKFWSAIAFCDEVKT